MMRDRVTAKQRVKGYRDTWLINLMGAIALYLLIATFAYLIIFANIGAI